MSTEAIATEDAAWWSESTGPSAWAAVSTHELHWFHATRHAWLSCREPCAATDLPRWVGWSADAASPHELLTAWVPWATLRLEESGSPVVRWLHGGLTNAAFNELDRHVLAGHGDSVSLVGVPPGDAVACESVELRLLLDESAVMAHALVGELGLAPPHSRLAIYLPNDARAVTCIEASKRLGAVYVAVASGTSSHALAGRLVDTATAVLLSSSEVIATAREARRLAANQMGRPAVGVLVPRFTHALRAASFGCGDDDDAAVYVAVLDGWQSATSALHSARERLLELRNGGGGGRASLTSSAAAQAAEAARQRVEALWRLSLPRPVESNWPLFILYTSGSTGRPKGIVHTHGGYEVGLCLTSRAVFDLQPNADMLLVIATPGWITGQSYMIAAALLCRVPSILLEGSPVSPPDRFAATIERHGATVLKAGSTFLRMLMTIPESDVVVGSRDLSSLRVGTFCAEPVNGAVHAFAQRHLTPYYINSYWATEHGGLVWSRCLHASATQQPLLPDARTWPLPWIDGNVWQRTTAVEDVDADGCWSVAPDGVVGEVVIQHRYPYLALTVWQSDGFGTDEWRGDVVRWGAYFSGGSVSRGSVSGQMAYFQGDAAVRHPDGAYTFHGRSDEVINVGGNRIGTEEIESALLADTTRPEGSPLRNCAVVGMPDEVRGTVPVAFVVLHPPVCAVVGESGPPPPALAPTLDPAPSMLDAALQRRLGALVQRRLGPTAVPAMMVAVPCLPETHSGKYVRRLLQSMLVDAPLGELGSLRNPECIEPLRLLVRAALDARESEGSKGPLGHTRDGRHGEGEHGAAAEGTCAADSTPHDSMSLFSQPGADDHSLAVQGYLMFLVICCVIHAHYASRFLVYEASPWLELAHVWGRWMAMLCAFMLTGRTESVRCPLNRAFAANKLLKPSLLLVAIHWAYTTKHPYVLAFQADVLVDTLAFYHVYQVSWFLCALVVFRLIHCAAALAGLSPPQLAAVAVGIHTISESSYGIVTKQAAAALSIKGLAMMAGACARLPLDAPLLSLPRLLSTLCFSWVEEVFTVYWAAYCIAPWVLHGPQMRPSWLHLLWLHQDSLPSCCTARPRHPRTCGVPCPPRSGVPLLSFCSWSWSTHCAASVVATIRAMLPWLWLLFVGHTLLGSPGPAVRAGFGKCARLGGPLLPRLTLLPPLARLPLPAPLAESSEAHSHAWLIPAAKQRAGCCHATEASVREASPSIELAMTYYRIEYCVSLWALLAAAIFAHSCVHAWPSVARAVRVAAPRLVATATCLVPLVVDVTARLQPPSSWVETLPHESLPLQVCVLRLVGLSVQFAVIVAWTSLLPRRHTLVSRAGLTPMWAYLLHQTVRARLLPTANAHLKRIHEWSGGWLLPTACAPHTMCTRCPHNAHLPSSRA